MTKVARRTRQDDLERLRDLQREIAELEARAEGHLDHGRTGEALALQAEAGELRRVLRDGRKAQFPSRRFSEQVMR